MKSKNKFLVYKIIFIFLFFLIFPKASFSKTSSFQKVMRSNFPGYTISSRLTTFKKCKFLCSKNKKCKLFTIKKRNRGRNLVRCTLKKRIGKRYRSRLVTAYIKNQERSAKKTPHMVEFLILYAEDP